MEREILFRAKAINHDKGYHRTTYKNGDRIGQLVITPVVVAEFITDDIEERGSNAFGSTGI